MTTNVRDTEPGSAAGCAPASHGDLGGHDRHAGIDLRRLRPRRLWRGICPLSQGPQPDRPGDPGAGRCPRQLCAGRGAGGGPAAGSVGDIVGRRKVMLVAYAWFAVGMGADRVGVEHRRVRAAAVPHRHRRRCPGRHDRRARRRVRAAGKKNLCNAITLLGRSAGESAGRSLAILLLGSIGWRGMFWIGAIPLVTLLPLAFFKMPESPAWLASRGRMDEAIALAERTGMPTPAAPRSTAVTAVTAVTRRPSGNVRASPGCSGASTGSRRSCWD